jgi:hypothetical protein
VRDADLLTHIQAQWPNLIGGQFWVGGWWGSPSYVSFLRDVCGLALSSDIAARAQAYEDTATSACWWWPHRDFVIACERPTAIRLVGGRLHSTTGPAIVWPDGWGVYAVNGVRVPGDVIEDRATITIARIDAEQNAEVRRVMVELYGLARYVRDARLAVLDDARDPLGLPRRLFRGKDGALILEMHNSTPNGDGSARVYHGFVHPELRPLLPDGSIGEPQELSALAAVASTYGMRAEEYVLAVET